MPRLRSRDVSLARVLAPEVRVNVVAPGFVDTPWMVSGYGAERYAKLRDNYAGSAPLASVCRDLMQALTRGSTSAY